MACILWHLLVLHIVFFALIVVQSALNGVKVWKSFPLQFMFHGSSLARAEQLQEVEVVGDMEGKARDTPLQLRIQVCG